MKKRDPLRTEAAIRKAVTKFKRGECILGKLPGYEVEFWDQLGSDPIAIADLRDLYRKRKPLKGVTKKLRKAVR